MKTRIQSIDLVRGIVIVLMAIDHVRVYSGIPAGGPDPAVFFTRWITHFCAPVFVFYAGTSAFFYGLKVNNASMLSRYLVIRGVLLVLLELTVIRFFWAFHLNFSEFMLAGVIWMIGWSMILLALIIHLGPKIAGIIGVVIILFQNIFKLIPNLVPESARTSFGHVWEFIYSSGLEGPPGFPILYVLIPWVGVMAAGYGFGLILQFDDVKRKKLLTLLGLSAILIFIVVGSWLAFTPKENDPPFIFRLLNQRKYPASQLYLLMTLGPAILLMAFTEKIKGWLVNVFITFGRVPFFYYLLHILVIHLTALIFNYFLFGNTHQEWYLYAPFADVPQESRWSLSLLYLAFIIDIPILFFACRWYDRYKSNHPEKKWLSFL